MNELKPCPFCKEPKKVGIKHDSKRRNGKYVECVYARCKPCGGRGTIIFLDNNFGCNFEADVIEAEQKAIAAWNGCARRKESEAKE